MSADELLALRADLKRRVDAGEGDQPFPGPAAPGADIMDRLDGIAANPRPDDVEQPDEDLDDEPATKRRPVPARSAAGASLRRAEDGRSEQTRPPTRPRAGTASARRPWPPCAPARAGGFVDGERIGPTTSSLSRRRLGCMPDANVKEKSLSPPAREKSNDDAR